jgi:hypothetical protein
MKRISLLRESRAEVHRLRALYDPIYFPGRDEPDVLRAQLSRLWQAFRGAFGKGR